MPGRLTAAGRERLHATASQHVGEDRVPGLVVLVAHGDEVWAEPFGALAIGGKPVRRDSIFRIASTTKPVTAAATMALAAEGLIDVDAPVDALLPELADRRVLAKIDGPLTDTVPANRPITTHDLLTFTFGFGMVGEMFMAAEPWPVVAAANELRLGTFSPPDPDGQPDPDTWISGLGRLPLMAQPGERWMYNTGAAALGVLAARAAGVPFAEVLRSRIFEPLGMTSTGFWTAETDRLATCYQPGPDGLVVYDRPDGAWSRPPAFGNGADGLVSTVDDLLAFARMLLGGGSGVLPADAVSAITSDQLTDAQKARGGLGPDMFTELSWGYCMAVHPGGAFGWDGGLGTSWLVDPARDLIVIVLTQRMWETSDPPPVHKEIQAAAYAALA